MPPAKRLDAFTRSYVEAALWNTTDNSDDQGGDPLDKNYSINDIAPETMELMIEDCADFQERYADLLFESGIDDARAGVCFWLSRGGAGSGFFDEDSIDEEFQDPLQEAAESYGEFDLYLGDPDADGDVLIYGPPPEWYRSHRKPAPAVSEARRPMLRPKPRARSVRQAPPRPRYAGESNLPTTNIFWRDIPPGSKVELVGHSYVVTKPDGTRASAYWGGQDARAAQRTLDGMVLAGSLRETRGRSNDDNFTTLYLTPIARNNVEKRAFELAQTIGAEISLGHGDYINIDSRDRGVIDRAVKWLGTRNVVEISPAPPRRR